MSGLKEHSEQFTLEEIRAALLSPDIEPTLVWELTTRINLFEHFGELFSVEFGNRLIDEMRQWRAAEKESGAV